jgi:hypothetical protein
MAQSYLMGAANLSRSRGGLSCSASSSRSLLRTPSADPLRQLGEMSAMRLGWSSLGDGTRRGDGLRPCRAGQALYGHLCKELSCGQDPSKSGMHQMSEYVCGRNGLPTWINAAMWRWLVTGSWTNGTNHDFGGALIGGRRLHIVRRAAGGHVGVFVPLAGKAGLTTGSSDVRVPTDSS